MKILSVTADEYTKGREPTGKEGIGLDNKGFAALLGIIDRMIDTSEPLRAEYLRGYQRGIQVHSLGASDERIDEHSLLIDHSGGGSGDPYIDSYARGYRDGFEGVKPEDPPSPSRSSRPLLLASII